MGKAEDEILSIVLCDEVIDLGRENEAWKALSKKVTEACKTHGCFLVEYSKISVQQQDEIFSALKAVFDLPKETKSKCTKPALKRGGYMGRSYHLPLYEAFGIPSLDENEVRALANLMWHDGNPGFCEAVNSMNSKLEELFHILMRMIFDGLGIGSYYTLQAENNRSILRATKYDAPQGNGSNLGLAAHVDTTILTILCQNEVQGLEILSDNGNWSKVAIPKESLIVFVGETFEAWSNGIIRGVKHQVTMDSEKDRYSYAIFTLPKDGVTIHAPPELVDEEHPLLYRPFIFSDYYNAHMANHSCVLKDYAGHLILLNHNNET